MENNSISNEVILSRIFIIRRKKVMLDSDLADLYDVETKALNQAVKRNLERFPEDFSFVITKEESDKLLTSGPRSQIVTLKKGQNIKYLQRVFTEQGVAMLSSVLKSKRAIQVNIQIVRTFTKLREILLQNKELSEKLDKIEGKYDKQISDIFKIIKYLVKEEEKPKEKLGFNTSN